MKKTMWKWKVVITLLVCMAAVGGNWSSCKVQAETLEDFKTYGDFIYTVSEDEIVIESYTGTEGDVTIPGTIDEKSVTSIGNIAFRGHSELTSITIPASVTSIGVNAFENCSKLTSITFTAVSSLMSIGDSAFTNCESLKEITIPNNVKSIGNSAFANCESLTSITIPASVTSIGEYTFSYSGLTNITFTAVSSLTSIGDNAFANCESLKEITIPNSVKSIGKYAFDFCPNLEKIMVEEGNAVYTSPMVTVDEEQKPCNAILAEEGTVLLYGCKATIIPNSVTDIGWFAFRGCSGLTSITIPASVTDIGLFAFQGCSGLTNITIPNSMTSIGEGAFAFCESLKEITIPASVTSIGEGAFDFCSKNLVIYTSADSEACKYAWEYGITVKDMAKNPLDLPIEPENPTPTTPGGTAQDTKPVTTPTTETPAQTSVPAAKGTVLVAADVKAEVRVTSDDAANPTVEYLKSTDKYAKKVTVPDAVTVDGITYQVTSVAAKAFAKNKKLTSVTIGKNVTSIGKDAFKNCTALKSVTIQSGSLTKIGASAFSGDKKLVKMTLKTTKLTKKSIGKNALKGTNKKLKIKVPKNQIAKYKAYFKGKGNKSVKVTK